MLNLITLTMDIIFYNLINGKYYRFMGYLIDHLRQQDLWQ